VTDGAAIGHDVGLKLGLPEGHALGTLDGDPPKHDVGNALGLALGVTDGAAIGHDVGLKLGQPDGIIYCGVYVNVPDFAIVQPGTR
jgi:hypothetical protein